MQSRSCIPWYDRTPAVDCGSAAGVSRWQVGIRLLAAKTEEDPSYGQSQGWEPRASVAFTRNLEATYIIDAAASQPCHP